MRESPEQVLTEISDEEELLRLYYESARSVVMERSGNFDRDIAQLNMRVLNYAVRKGMDYPEYVRSPSS